MPYEDQFLPYELLLKYQDALIPTLIAYDQQIAGNPRWESSIQEAKQYLEDTTDEERLKGAGKIIRDTIDTIEDTAPKFRRIPRKSLIKELIRTDIAIRNARQIER